MPRLSDELRAQRRRHILTSAWSCFSRDGFHATSMDQVVAASGMSTSAVYRYFRSKDELIEATVDEALDQLEELLAAQLAARPVPAPHELVAALIDNIRMRKKNPDYDLSQLAMQSWAEALRRPHLAERSAQFYRTVERRLGELAVRWQDAGYLSREADTAAVAALLTALMPGFVVFEQLVSPVSPDRLLAGIADLADRSAADR